MKTRLLGGLIITGVLAGALTAAWAGSPGPGFVSLFNGKDLTGWAGRTNHWSVQDGVITGETTRDNPAKGNNFLIARENGQDLIVKDFEIQFDYKFTGTNFGNSGLQFRSQDLGNFVVHGYQADCELGPTFSGILYEEGGRGVLCQRGQKVVIHDNNGRPRIEVTGSVGDSQASQANIQPNGWNHYVVIAQGNHIQEFINGKQTVDVTDEQTAKAAQSGILAFQIHQGTPMKIQFKDIWIKKL